MPNVARAQGSLAQPVAQLPLRERSHGMPAPLLALQQALLRRAGGDRVMAQVLAAVPTAGLDAVLVAAELVLETGAVSAEHVLNVLGRLNASPPPEQVETALRLNEAPRADTGRYDRLRDQAGQEVDHA